MDIVTRLFPSRPTKAESGIGAVMMSNSPTVSMFQRSPQSMMKDAQAVAISDVTIRAAERVIANRVATTEWKLEDENDLTVGDGPDENADPRYLAVKGLLETPYRPQPGDPVSMVPRTWNQLAQITARHMGICGSAFWYLDQTDALAGTPLNILAVNPARMTPVLDDNGALLDWVLDADRRGGGTPLGLLNVIQFTIEPPDTGVFPPGLVETALAKVEIGSFSDRHISMMLSAGGRLSGIMSPKEGYLDDAVYRQLVRDIRTISEAPDAAKRMLILRGPVEYKEAAVSPSDLDLVALNTLTRDDKPRSGASRIPSSASRPRAASAAARRRTATRPSSGATRSTRASARWPRVSSSNSSTASPRSASSSNLSSRNPSSRTRCRSSTWR